MVPLVMANEPGRRRTVFCSWAMRKVGKPRCWWSHFVESGCREDIVPILLSSHRLARIFRVCPGLLRLVVLMAWYITRLHCLQVRLIEEEYIVRSAIWYSRGYFSIQFVLERIFFVDLVKPVFLSCARYYQAPNVLGPDASHFATILRCLIIRVCICKVWKKQFRKISCWLIYNVPVL